MKIIILLLTAFLLSGCGKSNNTIIEPEIEKRESITNEAETEQELASDRQPYKIMDGMQYLFASETDGYCLVVNGIEEREEGIVPEFILLGEDNVLKVVIESTGKRKMALQVLVDYIQVPVIVDGETYDTYSHL